MRRYYSVLVLSSFFISSSVIAAHTDYFADVLYLKTTETVDWAYKNNLIANNQVIAYQTTEYHFKPGVRLGVAHHNNYTLKGTYTGYQTKAKAYAQGNLVSAFMGGKFSQGTNFFTFGTMNAKIDLHSLDLSISKPIDLDKDITLTPALGFKVACIHQSIVTEFSGTNPIREQVKNTFLGAGPTLALEYKQLLDQNMDAKYYFLGMVSTRYLQGHWKLTDRTYNSSGILTFDTKGRHHMGAFGMDTSLGLQIEKGDLSVNLGYEMQNWFDQYQVFDDGTGGQSKNLILRVCN